LERSWRRFLWWQLRIYKGGERVEGRSLFEQLAKYDLDAKLLFKGSACLGEKQRVKPEFQKCRLNIYLIGLQTTEVMHEILKFVQDAFSTVSGFFFHGVLLLEGQRKLWQLTATSSPWIV
jgi:hypothetical protein